MPDPAPPPKRQAPKRPPTFGTPEYWQEVRARDRWVEQEELREADGYGLAPWEVLNDD